MKTFIMDIDFTILYTPCIDGIWDYSQSQPYQKMIDKINDLHAAGNMIVLFTARGMGSQNGDLEAIEKHCRPVIEKWMEEHNVKYDKLIMGKPWGPGDLYYVDDKNLTIDQFLKDENYENTLKNNRKSLYE